MNLSDLSIEGLTQLEARLAGDLEMVRRVKALVVEYQKMDARGANVLGGAAAAPAASPGGSAAGAPPCNPAPVVRLGSNEERLTEALAATKPGGFILEDLSRATYSPYGCIAKDTIKAWVKSMVRKGKIRVVEVRAGRIGSVYAAVRPEASGSGGQGGAE